MSKRELIFLGSSGAIQVPAFFCSCQVCEAVRRNPVQRRTRASIALIGKEIVLIDATPDLEFQLEREAIRTIDRIFITHWHYDHVWGLGSLGESSALAKWQKIDIYLPYQVIHHFDQELAYMKDKVSIHPIKTGDIFELPDATWHVVKTTHTEDSIGFIVESSQKFAYLVDSVKPPPETEAKLKGIDFLILEGTLDELELKEGERWFNFSIQEAINFWKQTEVDKCILTHLSCHSWKNARLVAGFLLSERKKYELKYPGLRFAYDGMRVAL